MPKNNPHSRGKSKDELIKAMKDTKSKPSSSVQSTSNNTSSVSKRSGKEGKKNKKGSPELISIVAVQHNLHELHKIRVFSGIATGTAAGILDLKGLLGFALFLAVFLITSLILFLKMKMSVTQFFRPWNKFISQSLWDSTMSFVLFWTFFANVLYLYG